MASPSTASQMRWKTVLRNSRRKKKRHRTENGHSVSQWKRRTSILPAYSLIQYPLTLLHYYRCIVCSFFLIKFTRFCLHIVVTCKYTMWLRKRRVSTILLGTDFAHTVLTRAASPCVSSIFYETRWTTYISHTGLNVSTYALTGEIIAMQNRQRQTDGVGQRRIPPTDS